MKKPSISNLFKNSLKSVILILDIFCLAAHIFFLILFAHLGVEFMAVFNIFSVLTYLILAVLIVRFQKLNESVFIALLEIIIHACCAIVCVGWSWGFAMFLVCIAPVPFLLDLKSKFTPFVISFLIIATFIALKIFTIFESTTIYKIDDKFAVSAMYVFNSTLAMLMIITIAAIFKITRQQALNDLNDRNEKLSKLAAIDPLTQLFNRRAMTEYMIAVHEKAIRSDTSYIVAMGDIDDFKHVNDTYGHASGDKVIETVAKIMTSCVPTEGYVCRWGGEELLFIVPFCNYEKGTLIADRIRTRLENTVFNSGNRTFSVTITFGVFENDGSISYEKAISNADKYLYYGKRTGKNKVVNILNEVDALILGAVP